MLSLNGWLKRLTDQYRYGLRAKRLTQAPSETSAANLAPTPAFHAPSRSEMQALQLRKFWSNRTYYGRLEDIELSRAGIIHLGIISNMQVPPGAFINIESVILYFSKNYRLATEEQQTSWRQMVDQYCIDGICRSWELSRDPEIGKLLEEQAWTATGPALLKILTAFRANHVERLNDLTAKDAKLLLLACEDIDPIIAERARAYIQNLPQPALLKGVADMWWQEREPLLWSVLMAGNYLPKPAGKVGVLVALKSGHEDTLFNGTATTVKHLVEACYGQDGAIREAGLRALAQLKRVVAQQALCKIIIERELPQIEKIVIAQGYLPTEVAQKALFFFTTEQWGEYDKLDFDRSHLQKAYQTATSAFKRRLAEKIRKAGQPEYLEIITGGGYHFHNPEISPEEAQLTVEMLTANRDWENLWPLVFQLNLMWSGAIIAQLRKAGWQPATTEERDLFEQLKPLVSKDGLYEHILQTYKLLPLTLLKAQGQLTAGRINSLAFSPTQPWLAFGTGTGKVIVWNIQTAQREAILTGAVRSIGQIAFTADGILVCAEQTTKGNDPCKLYYWQGKGTSLTAFGQHTGSITVLHALNEQAVVSGGRDGSIRLWDIGTVSLKSSVNLTDWPRIACLSEDSKVLALWLHRRIRLLSLPDLESITEFSSNTAKIAHSMTFLPDNKTIMAGRFKEWIAMYHNKNPKTPTWRPVPARLKSDTIKNITDVEGLAVLAEHELVVAAHNNGTLYFLELDNYFKVRDQVKSPHRKIMSLAVSPDQAFMAVASADGAFSLWDLRVLDLDQLFEKSLAQTSVRHLVALNLMLENGPELPIELQEVLQYSKLVLQHRLRYEIELGQETPSVKTGHFDIEIEIAS